MRGLASRGVRPCLHHSSSAASGLARTRRAITPPTQISLTSGDAFVVLLPGVLTAAFVLDISARQRRSDALQQQIDVVEQESEALRERQLRAWDRIQTRSIRRGLVEQKRLMSSVATQEWSNANSVDELDPEQFKADFENFEATDTSNAKPTHDRFDDLCRDPENIDMQIRYERLVATRLALSMMLELRAGRTGAIPPPYKIDPNSPSMDYIVHQLEKVVAMIRRLRIQDIPFGIHLPEDVKEQKELLNNAIMGQIDLYKNQEIHLPQLITAYTHLVKEYKVGPPVHTHVRLMRAIAHFQKHSTFARYVEEAIWNSHEKLDDFTLSSIFFRLGKDQESHRLADLQDRLTKTDSWPQPARHWFRTQVNGLSVNLPATAHPYTLPALIRATLLNQQQSVAEAQAVVFMERLRTCPQRQDPICKYWVVSVFLQSYAEWGSWMTGRRWLETAVTWAEEFYTAGDHIIGRVILRMLDFCVSCQQRDAYAQILNAALSANLQVPAVDETLTERITERMQHIRMDWINQAKQRVVTRDGPVDINSFRKHLSGLFDEPQTLLPMQKPFHPSEGYIPHDPAAVRHQVESWTREAWKTSSTRNNPKHTTLKDVAVAGDAPFVRSPVRHSDDFTLPEPIVPLPSQSFEPLAMTRNIESTIDQTESISAHEIEASSNEVEDNQQEYMSPFFQEAEEMNNKLEKPPSYFDNQDLEELIRPSQDDELAQLRAALETANKKVSLLERQLSTTQFQTHNENGTHDAQITVSQTG